METQIFYWTGVIIWWGICLTAILGIFSLVIFTPILTFQKSRSGWWRWWTIAKFADLGWEPKELQRIAHRVGGCNDDFLRKAQRIIEEGEKNGSNL